MKWNFNAASFRIALVKSDVCRKRYINFYYHRYLLKRTFLTMKFRIRLVIPVYTQTGAETFGSVIFIIFIRLHAFFMMCNFCSCAIFVSYSQVKIWMWKRRKDRVALMQSPHERNDPLPLANKRVKKIRWRSERSSLLQKLYLIRTKKKLLNYSRPHFSSR